MTTVATSLMPDTAVEPAESDLSLLRRYIDTGDTEAFSQIVQRYGRVVYSASLRILGDEGRAQDVSQETFFRLMRQPRLITHSLGGWLHLTATHLAVDVRRSEISRRQREQIYGQEQQAFRAAEPTWSEISPFIDQALNEVKEPTRTLLIRHFLGGISQAEIAAEMNVSAATISRRVKSGLDELQQSLRKKGIYLGLAALAAFCTTHTASAAPATFLTELGKMQLIASFRAMPPGPPAPPMSAPSIFKMGLDTNVFISRYFFAKLIALTLLIAAFALAVSVSWHSSNDTMQSNPSVEPQRATQ